MEDVEYAVYAVTKYVVERKDPVGGVSLHGSYDDEHTADAVAKALAESEATCAQCVIGGPVIGPFRFMLPKLIRVGRW